MKSNMANSRRRIAAIVFLLLLNSVDGVKSVFKYILLCLAILAMISCGRNEPLADYEPKSPGEAALKTVFLEFQDGVNRRDADKVAGLIHKGASLMVGRDREVLSRVEYIKVLPKRLAENPAISFGRPKMKISAETAEVKIYMTRGNYNGLVVYNMIRDDSKWYIKSWRY